MQQKLYISTNYMSGGLNDVLDQIEYGDSILFDNTMFSKGKAIECYDLYDVERFVLKVLIGSCENSIFEIDLDGLNIPIRKYDLTSFSISIEENYVFIYDGDKKVCNEFECDNEDEATSFAASLKQLFVEAEGHIFLLDACNINKNFVRYSHDTWL